MDCNILDFDQLRNPTFDTAEPAPGVRLGGGASIDKSSVEPPFIVGDHSRYRRCSFGRFFAAGQGCLAADVTFGSFVSLGDRVSVNAGEHPLRRLTTHLFPYNRTEIGRAHV